MASLEILGNQLYYDGVVVATLKSEAEVGASLLTEFRARIGCKEGNYHPSLTYEKLLGPFLYKKAKKGHQI